MEDTRLSPKVCTCCGEEDMIDNPNNYCLHCGHDITTGELPGDPIKVNIMDKVEVVVAKDATVEDLKKMDPIDRVSTLLEIKVLERSVPTDDGVALNEGYEFAFEGAIPELAHGIANLALLMDEDEELGDLGGGVLITLASEFYHKLKSEGGK
jgi:hypothetical protein